MYKIFIKIRYLNQEIAVRTVNDLVVICIEIHTIKVYLECSLNCVTPKMG